MKNYLQEYGAKKVSKHQEGGAMQAPAAPAEQGGQDIQSAIMQAYQSQDPQMALQVINMIVEQMQAQQGGEAAGAEMPAARKGMRLNTPVFRKGGKLI